MVVFKPKSAAPRRGGERVRLLRVTSIGRYMLSPLTPGLAKTSTQNHPKINQSRKKCLFLASKFGIVFSMPFFHHFFDFVSILAPLLAPFWHHFTSFLRDFFRHRSRLPAAIVPPAGLGKRGCERKSCKTTRKFENVAKSVQNGAKGCQSRAKSAPKDPNLSHKDTKMTPIGSKGKPKAPQRTPTGATRAPK